MTIAAGGLLALIRARYPGPEWAVLDELHDGTGGSGTRRFDAVAFNCWPSRGFVRLGFEIKVTRGDFARELADHAKRAALERHCHEVYFVVTATRSTSSSPRTSAPPGTYRSHGACSRSAASACTAPARPPTARSAS